MTIEEMTVEEARLSGLLRGRMVGNVSRARAGCPDEMTGPYILKCLKGHPARRQRRSKRIRHSIWAGWFILFGFEDCMEERQTHEAGVRFGWCPELKLEAE